MSPALTALPRFPNLAADIRMRNHARIRRLSLSNSYRSLARALLHNTDYYNSHQVMTSAHFECSESHANPTRSHARASERPRGLPLDSPCPHGRGASTSSARLLTVARGRAGSSAEPYPTSSSFAGSVLAFRSKRSASEL